MKTDAARRPVFCGICVYGCLWKRNGDCHGKRNGPPGRAFPGRVSVRRADYAGVCACFIRFRRHGGGGGLPWPVALLISLSNFTSAGQVAGANLMMTGAPLPEIGVTVFIINIRYFLMSLSLSQKLQSMPVMKRLLAANGVTDEIFFLAMQQKGQLSGWFFAGLAAGPILAGRPAHCWEDWRAPSCRRRFLRAGIAPVWDVHLHCDPARQKSHPVALVTAGAVLLACLFRYMPGLKLLPSGWALILCAVAAAAAGAFFFPVGEETDGAEPAEVGRTV